MKEKPIIFKGEMIRAILEGRKTQTRRVVKYPVILQSAISVKLIIDNLYNLEFDNPKLIITDVINCPYGQPGDGLWVRETWDVFALPGEVTSIVRKADQTAIPMLGEVARLAKKYHRLDNSHKWRPSIHMPRWASRIMLEITNVRVERVQDITVEGAKAEGVIPLGVEGDSRRWRGAFRELWDSINKKQGYGWDENPWVWAIEFKRVNQ